MGTSNSITGAAVIYSSGGGGAFANSDPGAVGGTGAGRGAGDTSDATSGTNFGSGGGGANSAVGTTFGGDGRQGVVYLRYPGPPRATGGTVTTVSGDTLHTFTSNANFVSL